MKDVKIEQIKRSQSPNRCKNTAIDEIENKTYEAISRMRLRKCLEYAEVPQQCEIRNQRELIGYQHKREKGGCKIR